MPTHARPHRRPYVRYFGPARPRRGPIPFAVIGQKINPAILGKWCCHREARWRVISASRGGAFGALLRAPQPGGVRNIRAGTCHNAPCPGRVMTDFPIPRICAALALAFSGSRPRIRLRFQLLPQGWFALADQTEWLERRFRDLPAETASRTPKPGRSGTPTRPLPLP
jgi:hypothetical protein